MSPSMQMAAPDSWFSHLALETNPKANKNTWLEQVGTLTIGMRRRQRP